MDQCRILPRKAGRLALQCDGLTLEEVRVGGFLTHFVYLRKGECVCRKNVTAGMQC